MAQSKNDPRMAFKAEQYDQYASIRRVFVLSYFYEDKSIEMTEIRNNKLYLKRTPIDIPKSAFFLGARLTIFGKPTTLTGYADLTTQHLCEELSEMTCVLVTEPSFNHLGRYVSILTEECGFTVSAIQMAWVVADTIEQYDFPAELKESRIVVAQCVRTGAVEKGFDFIARCPGTCTAADAEQAGKWSRFCTACAAKPLAVFDEQNSSVVVIKQHVLDTQRQGNVIQQLVDLGLEPTGLTSVTLSSSVVDKFLVPYRGVLPELVATAASLAGNVWILQLVSLDDSLNVVEAVREECGPYDTVIAKKLFPKTIRAKFGLDEARNAVHCCDLPGEGPVYTDFFFKK